MKEPVSGMSLSIDASLSIRESVERSLKYFPPEVRSIYAAAPELLSALQGLVERGTDSPQHMAAEAAIAKALGK